MMYAIVKNVVTPASTSVRTVVWFADNLNKRSISWIAESGILPGVYAPHSESRAGKQRLDCGINVLNHRKSHATAIAAPVGETRAAQAR